MMVTMKRLLIALVTALALVAIPGVAQADPPYVNRNDAELQREAADAQYQAPPWILNQQPPAQGYGPADIILGVTLVVGLVVLW